MAHVVCQLNVEADRATFVWSEGPASFEPYVLDRMVFKDFQEVAQQARDKLADLVKDYLYDASRVPESSYALAVAGFELYEAMFQPAAEQARQAKQVRKWLEKLAHQEQVDTLEVVVESPWLLPWNVVYDEEPEKSDFLANDDSPDHWLPFWGLRYNLAGGRRVDPLRRMPVLRDPKVLMVVDPEIRDGLPEADQQRLAQFISSRGLTVVHSKDALHDAVAAQRPDLLYWLSHARPDALVLAGEEISPRQMRKLLRQEDDERFGGLAFLNACQTAEHSESGSFFEAFHSVGFSGMIGTEHQTVDQFANPLGLDFLEAFLDRGEPVGETLRKLRARVPLGLLYGAYCPPEIRVEKETRRKGLDIRQVVVQGVAMSAPVASAAAVAPPARTDVEAFAPLPALPYRSLANFERQDRALFAGRDQDVERFARLLDESTTRILVLHGESGVGKSSFLHAGVIPYLENECHGYRFLRDYQSTGEGGASQDQRPVLFLRATNDLFGQLAQGICQWCARPVRYQTPLADVVTIDLPAILTTFLGERTSPAALRRALRADPAALGRLLAALANELPFTPILVIDQGEETLTLARNLEELRSGREALEMLRRTVDAAESFKLIFSLRTEYYGRVVDRLRRGSSDSLRIRDYLLTDFDEPRLREAILRPTSDEPLGLSRETPRAKYGFSYAPGVAEEIARRVVQFTSQRRDSVLPLMQVICSQLYELTQQRSDTTIRLADLDALGGVEGGMRRHVERLLQDLLGNTPQDRTHVKLLFTQLYLRQPDGTLTTALLAKDEVARRWTGREPFDDFLRRACELRLLKVNTLRIGGDDERPYVSLGHDALARLAADWDAEFDRVRRMRKWLIVVGAISIVAAVMAYLAAWALLERRQAIAHQREANRRFLESRAAIDDWFTSVGVGLKDLPYTDQVRNKLLRDAAAQYARFAAEKGTDRDVALEAAKAQVRLSELSVELGDLAQAETQGRAAVTSFDALLADPQRAPTIERECATARARLAAVYVARQRPGDAQAELEAALKLLAPLVNAPASRPEDRAVRANLFADLAQLQFSQGEAALAAVLFEPALEDAKQLVADQAPRAPALLAALLHGQAAVLGELGRNDEAVKSLRRAVESWQALVERNDAERAHHEGLAGSRMDLATQLQLVGRDEASRQEYERAVAEYQQLVDVYGPVRHYRENLARAQANLALAWHRVGRNQDAAKLLLEALNTFTDLAAHHPAAALNQEAPIGTKAVLAAVFSELGDESLAKSGLEEAVAQWNERIGSSASRPFERERRGATRLALGRVLYKLGQLDEAHATLEAALADLAGPAPVTQDLRASCLVAQADVLHARQDTEGARKLLREALAIREQLKGAEWTYHLAWMLTHGVDPELRDPRRAATLAKQLVADSPDNASYRGIYGAALVRMAIAEANKSEARTSLGEGIAALRESLERRSPADCADLFCLAQALDERGEKDEARKTYEQAVEVLTETRPGNIERRRLREETAARLGIPLEKPSDIPPRG